MTKKQFKKLKIGDRIILKNDLIISQRYGLITFIPAMTEIKGEIKKVTNVKSYGIIWIEDRYHFGYSYEMFDKVFKFGK